MMISTSRDGFSLHQPHPPTPSLSLSLSVCVDHPPWMCGLQRSPETSTNHHRMHLAGGCRKSEASSTNTLYSSHPNGATTRIRSRQHGENHRDTSWPGRARGEVSRVAPLCREQGCTARTNGDRRFCP